jgi:trimeric autotransporter adhesin
MKRALLLLLMAQAIFVDTRAQVVNYGFGSGTSGNLSTYIGWFSGNLSNSSTTKNSFIGAYSGFVNSSGTENTALGVRTLYANTSGGANAANGFEALYSNTTGSFNTSEGYLTMHSNTTGSGNTANGAYALTANVDGSDNTASGYFSLYVNRNGTGNTANGIRTMYSNSAGSYNAAVGFESLYSNVTGGSNAAVGAKAAYLNSRGGWNAAFGSSALYNNTIGNFNTGVGFNAGPNGPGFDNTTAIGNGATTTASNQVRIGNTSVTSIGGQVMWTTLSDGRFKRNIKEDVSGLEFIKKLRPVSYEIDKKAVNAFLGNSEMPENDSEAKKPTERTAGFIAQEVEALVKKTGFVFHGVEVPKSERDHYGIRYEAFVVPLVKAVQELAAKVGEQEEKSEAQQIEIATLKEKLSAYEGSTLENNSSAKVGLLQNNPNPFSVDTEIRMTLPETSVNASLIIYNMEGKQLKSIAVAERGNASVKISGSDLYAGIYLYALVVDGKIVDTKRLVLTK